MNDPGVSSPRIIGLIAALWVVSDLGYYFLLPALGVTPEYNQSAMAIALYYIYWVGLCVVLFSPLYATWQRQSGWNAFDNRLLSASIWTVMFVAAILFVAVVIPALPEFTPREGTTPPELPLANPWYFLPKSVDILFQQMLVTALVMALAARGMALRAISLSCAALFGTSHILLLLGGSPVGYVARFTVAAALFGLIFPALILRVRNGLAFSYAVHWAFYAVVIVLARTAF